MIVTGHSKGGNEAQYVTLESQYGNLIDNCYSIDGQGFSEQAIEHFQELYGIDYYNEQISKMYSINGENDYVHDLGIVVIPEENTYFIKTPDASGVGDFHDIKYMLEGAGLNWTYDENGNLVEVQQGHIGQLAKALSRKMQELNQEELEDCAITIMSLLEAFMPYNDENGEKVLGGQYHTGTGGTFMTVEEFVGFLAYGMPLIAETVFATGEGWMLITEGVKKAYEEKGVMGAAGVMFITAICIVLVDKILDEYDWKVKLLEIYTDIIECMQNVEKRLKDWIVELIQTLGEIMNLVSDKVIEFTVGYKYAIGNPDIIVDTYKLENYAQRLRSVNSRIAKLDGRIDTLYGKVGLLDLWNLMQADLLTGYSWRLGQCADYLSETASDFNGVENELLGKL